MSRVLRRIMVVAEEVGDDIDEDVLPDSSVDTARRLETELIL